MSLVQRFWFLLVMLLACAPQQQQDFSVLLSSPKIQRIGRHTLEFRLFQNNRPLEVAEIDIVGQMTHAGMAPVYAVAQHLGKGRYQSPQFNFHMAGDWVLILSYQDQNKVFTAEIPMEVNP